MKHLTKFSIIAALALCLAASATAGFAVAEPTAAETKFDLAIDDGLVTLHARDGSVKRIVEELGRLLEFEVVDLSGDRETTATVDLDKVPVAEALRSLGGDTGYLYLVDSLEPGARITRLVIVAADDTDGTEGGVRRTPDGSQPFRFEIDPSRLARPARPENETNKANDG